MSKEKMARRKAMGDDPTAQSKSNSSQAGAIPAPQPNPGMPQGPGNLMNNPMNGNSFNQQIGSMSGANLYPYGDGGLPIKDGRMGGVGFIPNSGRPQSIVSGRGYQANGPYNAQVQPQGKTMEMMEGMGLAQDAGKIMERQYGEGQPGPFRPGPMGMHPYSGPLEGGAPSPAQPDPRMPQQMFDVMPLQGMPDAQAAVGMEMTPGATPQKKGKK